MVVTISMALGVEQEEVIFGEGPHHMVVWQFEVTALTCKVKAKVLQA